MRPPTSYLNRFLDIVERVGNFLPHPASLFAIFALAIVVFSGIFASFNLSVSHPSTGETIEVISLMNVEGLHRMLTRMVTNFTSFAPLGTVFVSMLGIGLAESSGLIGAALKKLVLSAPPKLLTFAIVLAGVLSNMASEIGYVLLVPLAAIIFYSAGRHPLVGLAAAFAGVSGGYSANLLLGKGGSRSRQEQALPVRGRRRAHRRGLDALRANHALVPSFIPLHRHGSLL